jgi:serine phosphatase RsbU (regulator of sigma subunit)
VELTRGDRLVLYTDGITEARNAADDEFGEDRLAGLAVEHRGCSAAALQTRIVADVAQYTAGRFQDDATLIVLASEGNPRKWDEQPATRA